MPHHITALAAIIAVLLVPVVAYSVWRVIVRRRQRLAREAMRKGNVLYREWLDRSKQRPGSSDNSP